MSDITIVRVRDGDLAEILRNRPLEPAPELARARPR
jgi:hypothetical protein